MKRTLVFLGVFLLVCTVHACAQFLAWGLAERNSSALLLAGILMFPAFSVLRQMADLWFWPIFVLNSMLWASVATIGFRTLVRRMGWM